VTRALACVLAVGLLAACRVRPEPPVVPLGGDFTLTDQHGSAFTSASLRGKVVLVFFGYTFCPDVCPTTLSKLSAVTRALGKDGSRLKVVYVSVDPPRDTPEVMRAHLSMYGIDAVGLTGTADQVAAVAKQYGVAYTIERSEGAAGYTVSHSTTLYGLDAEGRTRYLFRYEATVDEIVDGVRSLIP
jgi:protein SCO1/2